MPPDTSSQVQGARFPFLPETGEMAVLMRSFDWSMTPLGPVEAWPQSLRSVVGLVIGSEFPMFLVWGPDLTIIYNDAYSEILGAKHPSALGSPFADVWAEIWPDIGPILERALAGEATYWENLPLIMNRKGYEEQTWFTFSYSPLRSESGAVAGMFCACTETTATVLAERRQMDEAERLRRLFGQAPGFMAVLRGPGHVFEMMNASYLQLVGHRDLIGKPVREALPEVEGQGFFELLDQVYRSGEAFAGRSMTIQLQRTEGAPPEDRMLDFVFQPITDDGEVTGIFAEGYDVTERHEAEKALRESEERFRLIADSAPVPMWVTKLDRTRGFVNRAYIDFLGITYEEAVTFDWRTIIHPDDLDRIIAESIAGEKSLKPFVLEGRYRRGDGEWRWLRSESQPRWGPNGEHQGFIGVAHDVTYMKVAEATLREVNETLEKRVAERTADLERALQTLQAEIAERLRAEEALRQAQKMDAVGQLTGGIAHDFNNLLTPIVGGLDMLASRLEDVRLKRIAETALESARRGAKLTGQLLAFSRIQRISMKPVAVNSVIANMKDFLQHSIGREIHIETRLNPEVGCAVCDENQLENAILNLAINARDAMDGAGTLTISTARLGERGGPDLAAGDYVCVSVADTGEGMPPEVLARALEPFFSTKPMGKGTGLGLAQVYGIAHQSGGTVRIESEQGKGTTVHILLPETAEAADAESRSEGAGASPKPKQKRGKILVIDDDPDVRSFIIDALEGLGHEVEEAENGEAGLEKLGQCDADLVLIDFAMPGMNGAEVAKRMREQDCDLPIVFVTGYAESEQLEAALGPDVPVLRKPFSLADLAAEVARRIAR